MKRLIVDEKDKIIGAKSRDVLDLAHDIYRVSALWLTNSKNEVLIAKRALNLRNSGGLYGPAVAGTVEENETYEDNIYKEAQEEIGLSGVMFVKGPKFRRAGRRNYFCQLFIASVDMKISDFTFDKREVDGIAWVRSEFLKNDIAKYPEKYVESMEKIIEVFY